MGDYAAFLNMQLGRTTGLLEETRRERDSALQNVQVLQKQVARLQSQIRRLQKAKSRR